MSLIAYSSVALRCFQMDLPFAGLYSGTKCGCTSVVGRNGVQDESLCNRECSGDATQDCGGGFREVTVFTTGAGEEWLMSYFKII